MRNTHHSSKTLRGAPACAGSGIPDQRPSGNLTCPVCGRSGFSATATLKLGTHLHADDIANTTSFGTPTVATTVTEITFTSDQHDAIKAFIDGHDKDTYAAMLATGVEAGQGAGGYVAYARKQGWSA